MTYQEFLDSYDDKKLKALANDELFYPKGFKYYDKLEREILEENNIPHKKNDKDYADYPCDNLVHEELWWDCCEIIEHLAQLVLDEREKRDKFIEDLKHTLKYTMDTLDKDFEDY